MTLALRIIDLAVTDENTGFSAVGEMASVIAEILQSKGKCMPHELLSKGFTFNEVLQHGYKAHCIAMIESRRQTADVRI